MKVVLGLNVAEAAFNPTPGDANGVDQDLYEQRGNEWVRLVQCFVFVPREECFVSRLLLLTPQLCHTTTKIDFFSSGKTIPGSTLFCQVLFLRQLP